MNKLIYITTFLIIGTQVVFSQADSVQINEGTKDSIDIKYDRIYKLFIVDNSHEIRHLWSLGLNGLSFSSQNLSYEQKIGNRWSNVSLIATSIRHNFDYHFSSIGLAFQDQIRFYHNLSRREKKGKNTNGFSGNYFGLAGGIGLTGTSVQIKLSDDNSNTYTISVNYYSSLSYGLQRKIGNIGYIGVYIGIGCNFSSYGTYVDSEHYYSQMLADFNPLLGIGFGFDIESFKELNRIFDKNTSM